MVLQDNGGEEGAFAVGELQCFAGLHAQHLDDMS